jgi:hypothetical protein
MYAAKVVLDSITPAGHRLTTMEVTIPRMVLAEFNTHRVFSRNSASSRAIPVKKMLERVRKDPFTPLFWGKNQKGMAASVELSSAEQEAALRTWLMARDTCANATEHLALSSLDVHKQTANRIIEPWLWHTVIVSSTEWPNFNNLRRHPAAQPEINKPANMLFEARAASKPASAVEGYWHLPYVYKEKAQLWFPNDIDDAKAMGDDLKVSWIEILKMVSVGRCARVSVLNHDGERKLGEDVEMFGKLKKNGHMSPLEHVARPMTKRELNTYRMYHYVIETPDGDAAYDSRDPYEVGDEIEGGEVKSVKVDHFCGNFDGWMQLRKTIPGESVFTG